MAADSNRSSGEDHRAIDARPTRKFFIEMLVKDIKLQDAIADLIDNSVDGSRRLRGDDSYDGLYVHLELTGSEFSIVDNCGGIDAEIARRYAFRFGRPDDAVATEHSVGQFGVGMKRALFKLGRHFTIRSQTASHRFTVDVDVHEWQAKEDDEWTFEFQEFESNEHPVPAERCGTSITVTSLVPEVSTVLADQTFVRYLRHTVGAQQREALGKDFEIKVNGVSVLHSPPMLLKSESVRPAHLRLHYNGAASAPVDVALYAGIAPRDDTASDPGAAGWYVFCNGRQILAHDRTETTGWGSDRETRIPRYHGQYALFRGYATFDSRDAARLPWNTTKNNVDIDSPLYRSVLAKMMDVMRPVITSLNRLDDELDSTNRPISDAIEAARPVPITEITEQSGFEIRAGAPRGPRLTSIQYKRPVDDVELLKEVTGASSNAELGEFTFDYFYQENVRG